MWYREIVSFCIAEGGSLVAGGIGCHDSSREYGGSMYPWIWGATSGGAPGKWSRTVVLQGGEAIPIGVGDLEGGGAGAAAGAPAGGGGGGGGLGAA